VMSAFRPTRPSTSKDAERDSQSLSPSDSGQGSAADQNIAQKGRKRRAPSHVSQNACTNCQKARAKVLILSFSRLTLTNIADELAFDSVMERSRPRVAGA